MGSSNRRSQGEDGPCHRCSHRLFNTDCTPCGPFSVIVGWYYKVDMSLDFRVFESTVMLLSVLISSSVLHDGHSNWLEGAMLMATYILIAIICWFIPEAES